MSLYYFSRLMSRMSVQEARIYAPKEMWYMYTMEYHSHQKKKIMPFATTWMDLEIGNLSEVYLKKKDNITWYHLHTETNKQTKKIQMNSFSKQKQTHRLREQTYGYQGLRMRVRNS